MLAYPHINPVLLSLGPLQIRWYGLMYVLGFIATYWLVGVQARRHQWKALLANVDNLNLALILGIILGGRLGYVLIYLWLLSVSSPGDLCDLGWRDVLSRGLYRRSAGWILVLPPQKAGFLDSRGPLCRHRAHWPFFR